MQHILIPDTASDAVMYKINNKILTSMNIRNSFKKIKLNLYRLTT